ncbi:integrase family protein [Acidithiobacillus thiooxidans]|uniref:tyrosine-type recombinase/integrase n=1 Tax=Acidithiobacillus thiooxidans TaxID=930 RepID=UPI001C073AD8|nr:integrase family protein [Acidithiobacillus thiooxidans]MBU2837942.1 integrase family protein [Acidithiobacillus thiooxidans]
MQKLTTRAIEAARPDSSKKDIYLRDGDGLELRVLPSGKKVWQFRYTFSGKRRVLTFGEYAVCSLREARLRAQDARKFLSIGQDPADEIKTKVVKHAASLNNSPSLRQAEAANTDSSPEATHRLIDLMLAYAQWKEESGKPAYAHDVRNNTRLYLKESAPELAIKPASECTSEDIAALLRPIHERGKLRTTGKLRSILSAAFQTALQAPYHPAIPKNLLGFNVKSNPVLAIPAIHTEPREHVLTQAELGQYASAVLAGTGVTYYCLALSLFAGGQRPTQVSRIREEDYSKSESILLVRDPKGKRSKPRLHYLPLGNFATQLIAQWHMPGSLLKNPVWFSVDGDTVMESTSLSHQCKRIQKTFGLEPFEMRDIRRTVETEMARLGFSKDLRAHLLSHGLGGIQDRHYDRYDRIDEKREALEKWEKYLLELMEPYHNKQA